MSPRKSDFEERAEALLQRIQRHTRGIDTLTVSEVRSLLKEIRTIGKLDLAGSLPDDALARVARMMQPAVQEARILVEGTSGRGTKKPTDQ
jgi:hypothetical protein